METNYIFELIIILIGLNIVYKSEKVDPQKNIIKYIATVAIFSAVQYLIVCHFSSGLPIFLEVFFNIWMFLFAVCLGKTFEYIWTKNTKFKLLVKLLLITAFIMLVFGILNSRRAKVDVRFNPRTYSFSYFW